MFHENLYMLLSKLDNDMRRDKSVMGTKSILRKGYWPYGIPMGYENKNKYARADRHEIVINKDGMLLKMAFKWKVEGKLCNKEIVALLEAKGLKLNTKNLALIFSNPFYCGYLSCRILPGELIEGKHPAIVDETMFMKVNNIVKENPIAGIPHQYRKDALPLKVFVKEEFSGSPLTGYHNKKKNLNYYKARDKGVGVNVSALKLNSLFEETLKQFEYDKDFKARLQEILTNKLKGQFSEVLENNKQNQSRVTEINNLLEKAEERFILDEITKEQYEKFRRKNIRQRTLIEEEMSKSKMLIRTWKKPLLKVSK